MVSGPLWSRASSAAKSVRHSPALVMLCSARSLSAWWLLAITHHSCGAVIRLALFFISLRSGNLHPGRTLCRRCQHPVDGNGSGAANHQKSRNRKHEQVILEALALLCSGPVHKEAEPIMNHRYGHNHIEEDSQCGNSGQEPKNQAEAAKEFRSKRQKREQHRNVHDVGKKAHSPAEAGPAEPAQHLLGAMCEENYPEHEAKHCGRTVIVGRNQFTKHG